ncbi:hypothetical protein NDU88_003824 [Pleurodeles waltl]|uniref:Uncharacterized protein n=1 Tax=Pleurodeles waltl TaxID=8319 RepID=A0AAV7NHS2_PLEWA|nr:hypothetical protein NDU88_003824 [Pleurodeles waltl]
MSGFQDAECGSKAVSRTARTRKLKPRRDLDINSIVNVQSLVTELVDPPEIRNAGSWRRLLAERVKVDLGTKAQSKWARQEGLEVSSDYWETSNRLNFSVLRGVNWHQIIFFSKWLLYRTPQPYLVWGLAILICDFAARK